MGVEHEMERVARIVAADQALDVHVRGITAYASPGQVTVPNVEHFSWLGSNANRMLHGLLDHECGHALFTDFAALIAWRKAKAPAKALDSLQNYLEDGYVERMQGLRYIGCGTNIALMNEWLYADSSRGSSLLDKFLEPFTPDPTALVLSAIGMVVTPHGGRTIEFFEKCNPMIGAVLRTIEPELREVAAVNTPKQTRALIALAERIFAKLSQDNASDKKPKPNQPKPGDGKQPGAPVAGTEADGPMIRVDWNGEALTATSRINEMIAQVFNQPDNMQPYMVFSHEFDAERDFSSEDLAHHTTAFLAAQREAREVSDALGNSFEAALRAAAFTAPVTGADEGEIDSDLLTQYAVGSVPSDQLYRTVEIGEAHTVAVEILCDCSGSMGPSKAALCQQAAIAMHTALQTVGIAHEITGFTTMATSEIYQHQWASGRQSQLHNTAHRMRTALSEAAARGTDIYRFARCVSNRASGDVKVPFHAIFKSWGSDDARGLMNITGISENLDGEGVLWAARRLAQRHETRKVLFVLSDGAPSGSNNREQGSRYLRETVKHVIASGIEVYGFGIESDAVAKYYPLWWKAQTHTDLIDIAMSGLTEVLTMNRVERARVFL